MDYELGTLGDLSSFVSTVKDTWNHDSLRNVERLELGAYAELETGAWPALLAHNISSLLEMFGGVKKLSIVVDHLRSSNLDKILSPAQKANLTFTKYTPDWTNHPEAFDIWQTPGTDIAIQTTPELCIVSTFKHDMFEKCLAQYCDAPEGKENGSPRHAYD